MSAETVSSDKKENKEVVKEQLISRKKDEMFSEADAKRYKLLAGLV